MKFSMLVVIFSSLLIFSSCVKSIDTENKYALIEKNGTDKEQFEAGKDYYFGRGVTADNEKAFKFFSSSSNKGNPYADHYLGRMYYLGIYVEKNEPKALNYFNNSIDIIINDSQNDNTEAFYCLGWCYYAGVGVLKDIQEAVKWWRKATEQGDATAQFNLGMVLCEWGGCSQEHAGSRKVV